MKKNIAMRVASLVLMCTIVTSCFVSSTFAKYTSSASGTDSVTVAKWSIEVSGNEIAVTGNKPTVSFDLFNTINDTKGGTESDVASGKIAPGTTGSFDLVIENNSEVNAKYGITFTSSNTNIPIQYRVGNGDWSTSIPEIVANDTNTKIGMGETATVNVQWQWAYEQADVASGDTNDTSVGIGSASTQDGTQVTVQAEITVTQID